MRKSSNIKMVADGLILGLVLFFSLGFLHHFVKEIWVNYLFKIIILSIFLGVYLNKYKNHLLKGDLLLKGIGKGILLSSIASITYCLLNLLSFIINPEWAIIRQGFEVLNGFDFVLINAIYFYEMLVFGGIISFLMVQKIQSRTYVKQY
ncbi:MAG: hypothetical protein IPN72_13470 [Saprospiraceae bacterium]|nr:hypothetical protein [Saprospiraceae bacterium]